MFHSRIFCSFLHICCNSTCSFAISLMHLMQLLKVENEERGLKMTQKPIVWLSLTKHKKYKGIFLVFSSKPVKFTQSEKLFQVSDLSLLLFFVWSMKELCMCKAQRWQNNFLLFIFLVECDFMLQHKRMTLGVTLIC